MSVYRREIPLTPLHLDCFGRLKPSAVLALTQQVSGEHSLLLGTGMPELEKKNLFWAVIRHRVQITRLPGAGETLTLETWPMPTTRVAYPRSTVAYDSQGREVFRTLALWVLMDSQSRAMVLPGKSGVEVSGDVRGGELSVPGSLMPRPFPQQSTRQVCFTDLDQNGHMNNTRYLDWVFDLLPSDFHRQYPVQDFTVCYLNEAREGSRLQMSWECLEGPVFRLEGVKPDPENPEKSQRIFAVELQF